jgi:hypothetical protein
MEGKIEKVRNTGSLGVRGGSQRKPEEAAAVCSTSKPDVRQYCEIRAGTTNPKH